MRGTVLFAVVAALAVGEARAAAPTGEGGPLLEQWKKIAAALEAASAGREPAPVPPTPRKVTWRARRITSIDLGAPLLALAAGDVNGDARAELVAVTEHELIVLGPSGPSTLDVLARTALPGELAAPRPRDPVGAVTIGDVDGDGVGDVSARSSRLARGAAFAMRDGALVELAPIEGFPLCGAVVGTLASGRNYFDGARGAAVPPAFASERSAPASRPFWSARCRDGIVDEDGVALRVFTAVDTAGIAHARVERRCRRGATCGGSGGWEEVGSAEVPSVGVAFDLADVDNDGRPELIASADGVPGDADAVTVRTLGAATATGTGTGAGAAAGGAAGAAKKDGKDDGVVFRKGFSGGVAGIAAGDVDGDGDVDVIAAVRLLGSQQVSLWLLD